MKTRRFFLAVSCALVFSGCAGGNDYAKPPSTMTPKSNQVETSGPAFVRVKKGPGWGWSGLEWIGVDEKSLASWRCALGDEGRVRSRNAYGAGALAGGVIAVVARAGGSTFFGAPSRPGDGHGHDGVQGEPPAGTSVLGAIRNVSRSYGGSFVAGAGAVLGCQLLLTSFPLDGVLGEDFKGLATALIVGGLSIPAVRPWVWKFFGEPPPPQVKAPPPSAGQLELAARGPGGRQIRDWPADGGFIPGAWHRLKGNLTVYGISTMVGLLVYDHLYDDMYNPADVNPACLAAEPAAPPAAPTQPARPAAEPAASVPPVVTGP